MNSKLKKMLPLASIFCGSLMFSTVHADTDSSTTDTTGSSTYKEITPPAGLHVDGGVGFAISADFIYWETREDNLQYALSGASNDSVPASTGFSQGQTYFPGFHYQPGFKVALVADLGHDNWDLAAEYTWLNNTGKKSEVEAAYTSSTLYPTVDPYTSTIDLTTGDTILTSASGIWSLHFNVVNLELGRNYFISENLTFRPHFGLSGSWINQNNSIHYTFGVGSASVLENLQELSTQKYWGVGFRTGLDSGWHFDENWSIYGDFAASTLWSSYRTTAKETIIGDTSNTVTYNTYAQSYGLQTVLDLEMGIRWAMAFDENSFGLTLQAGWDQQVWINHNQMTSGNLSLQGLVVKARFDF